MENNNSDNNLGHWICDNNIIPINAVGFIYEITNNLNNKKYIGKKVLKFKIKVRSKVSKKKVGGKSKIKNKPISKYITSDYKTYTGSSSKLNKDITQYGISNFTFKILYFCYSKTELSYKEIEEIIYKKAIYSKDYYNEYLYLRLRFRKI